MPEERTTQEQPVAQPAQTGGQVSDSSLDQGGAFIERRQGEKNKRFSQDNILPRHMKLEDGRMIHIKLLDDTSTLSTGDGKFSFGIDQAYHGLKLKRVFAYVTTVSSSGAPSFQVHNVTKSQDMLSTNVTIDANEFTSYTAAANHVVNRTQDDVSAGDIIRIDCDAAGTGAKGAGIVLVLA